LFDHAVVENGALLFNPAKREATPLADPPSPEFVERLRELGVSPLAVGRTIVATWEPHETTVLKVIHELALELHIIFNKGAVMILPANINKAYGLERALKVLRLSPHNVVGIGDAENDQAFLRICGCAVAVDNALRSVKARADLVVADHGHGVIELSQRLLESDMRSPLLQLPRVQPVLGTKPDNRPVYVSPYDVLLICGSSGAGKSTVVTALLEQMRDLAFQFCVLDPEGDYSELPDAIVIGDAKQEPRRAEIMGALTKPTVSVVINLLAVDETERPRFLAKLLPDLAKLRSETGRPHWLILDEAHHFLPTDADAPPLTWPRDFPATIAVTVEPDAIASPFLQVVSKVAGVGEGSLATIERFCIAAGWNFPAAEIDPPPSGHVHLLTRDSPLETLTVAKPKERQKRHARKYAEGDLGERRSFYFRGPEGALNLRAHNLSMFVQLAAGVDDKTWMHHLRGGEYSRWFRTVLDDSELADEAAAVELDTSLTAQLSRARMREMIERRYTKPSKS
jgi:hypothetical protein